MSVRFVLLLLPLALTACVGSMSEKPRTFNNDEYESLIHQKTPGIDDLDTTTKQDRDDAKWWHGFYGTKSAE